ncbi:MAG TPA: hypothetical protein VLH38_02345 [Patescibacteria group bacterium]|nr:hypothetical protein [Patescibacteria group bacterium]
MSKYQQFIFESYAFDPSSKTLELRYSLDGQLHFLESYRFDFNFTAYDPNALDQALQTLFFMAGVSYYKAYLPPEIVIKQGQLDTEQAAFFSKTYQRGLGEFWFVNKLDPHTVVTFPATTDHTAPLTVQHANSGLLVAVGGGKDSLASIELLRSQETVTTWSLNHRPQLQPLIDRVGLPHLWVERTWDTQLLTLNEQDALNGHIPISAIFACVGTVVAILAGKRDVVMSNEQSANEPTLQYQGMEINHQYSKSQEFERDYQQLLKHGFGEWVRYYSFLRPLSEVYIGELFSKISFKKYGDVFSSCNRAFVHSSEHMSWCGVCAKCAFIFMALTPFIDQKKLEALWGGKNLLLDPNLVATYRNLLGIAGDKPLDCVGDIKESRAAMRLAFTQYPELARSYHFEIPEDYDFRQIRGHEMPQEIYSVFTKSLAASHSILSHLLSPLSAITIEMHPGEYKDFGVAQDSDYPLAGVTFASEYGFLPGYIGEDGAELDFFVGSQVDGKQGSFIVFRPELKNGEHKFYVAMSDEELERTLIEYTPVIVQHISFKTNEELLAAILPFRSASMSQSIDERHE